MFPQARPGPVPEAGPPTRKKSASETPRPAWLSRTARCCFPRPARPAGPPPSPLRSPGCALVAPALRPVLSSRQALLLLLLQPRLRTLCSGFPLLFPTQISAAVSFVADFCRGVPAPHASLPALNTTGVQLFLAGRHWKHQRSRNCGCVYTGAPTCSSQKPSRSAAGQPGTPTGRAGC